MNNKQKKLLIRIIVAAVFFVNRVGDDYGATISTIVVTVVVLIFGEITPKMAAAVAQSRAKRILVPVNSCGNIIAGVPDLSIGRLVECVIEELKKTETGK